MSVEILNIRIFNKNQVEIRGRLAAFGGISYVLSPRDPISFFLFLSLVLCIRMHNVTFYSFLKSESTRFFRRFHGSVKHVIRAMIFAFYFVRTTKYVSVVLFKKLDDFCIHVTNNCACECRMSACECCVSWRTAKSEGRRRLRRSIGHRRSNFRVSNYLFVIYYLHVKYCNVMHIETLKYFVKNLQYFCIYNYYI